MPNSYNPNSDPTTTFATTASSPARRAVLVTPSDTLDLAPYAKALRVYASAAGSTLRVTPVGALDDLETVTLTLGAGTSIEPIAARRIWATGTTGTLVIHALFG